MKELIDFVTSLNKGCFTSVTLFNSTKMNKRNNPYYDRVSCKTVYSNCRLGCDYSNSIDASLGRNGLEGHFMADMPKGMHFINDFILQSDNNEEQFYLRVQMFGYTKVNKTYYLDGQEITDDIILEQIKTFMPKTSVSLKQSEMGLSEEQQVVVRNIKLENIVEIKQGEKLYLA